MDYLKKSSEEVVTCIGEPEEVSAIEQLNEEEKLGLILRWKNPTRSKQEKINKMKNVL